LPVVRQRLFCEIFDFPYLALFQGAGKTAVFTYFYSTPGNRVSAGESQTLAAGVSCRSPRSFFRSIIGRGWRAVVSCLGGNDRCGLCWQRGQVPFQKSDTHYYAPLSRILIRATTALRPLAMRLTRLSHEADCAEEGEANENSSRPVS
jgi:hypothetical protein